MHVPKDQWLTEELNAAETFLEEGGIVLGWQNQATKKNKESPYAIGGGISQQLTDQQNQTIQTRLKGFRDKYPAPEEKLEGIIETEPEVENPKKKEEAESKENTQEQRRTKIPATRKPDSPKQILQRVPTTELDPNMRRFENIKLMHNGLEGEDAIKQELMKQQKADFNIPYLLVRKKALFGLFINEWYLYSLDAKGELVKTEMDDTPAIVGVAKLVKDKNFAEVTTNTNQAVKDYFNKDAIFYNPKIDVEESQEYIWQFRYFQEMLCKILVQPEALAGKNVETAIDTIMEAYSQGMLVLNKSYSCLALSALEKWFEASIKSKPNSERLAKTYLHNRFQARLVKELELDATQDYYPSLRYQVFGQYLEGLRNTLDQIKKNPDENQSNNSRHARKTGTRLARQFIGANIYDNEVDIRAYDVNSRMDLINNKEGTVRVGRDQDGKDVREARHFIVREPNTGKAPFLTANYIHTTNHEKAEQNRTKASVKFTNTQVMEAKAAVTITYDDSKVTLEQAQDLMRIRLGELVVPPLGVSLSKYRRELESLASYVVMGGQGYQILDNHNHVIDQGRATYFSYACFPRLVNKDSADFQRYCQDGKFKEEKKNAFKEKCKDVIRLQILNACLTRLKEWQDKKNLNKPIHLAIATPPKDYFTMLDAENQAIAQALFAEAVADIAVNPQYIFRQLQQMADAAKIPTEYNQLLFGGLFVDDTSPEMIKQLGRINPQIPVIVAHKADMTALQANGLDTVICLMNSSLGPAGNTALDNYVRETVEDTITRKCIFWVQSLFGTANKVHLLNADHYNKTNVVAGKKLVITGDDLGEERDEKQIAILDPAIFKHLESVKLTELTMALQVYDKIIIGTDSEKAKEQNETLQENIKIGVDKKPKPRTQERIAILKAILGPEKFPEDLEIDQNSVVTEFIYSEKYEPKMPDSKRIRVTQFKKVAAYLPEDKVKDPLEIRSEVIEFFQTIRNNIGDSLTYAMKEQFEKFSEESAKQIITICKNFTDLCSNHFNAIKNKVNALLNEKYPTGWGSFFCCSANAENIETKNKLKNIFSSQSTNPKPDLEETQEIFVKN